VVDGRGALSGPREFWRRWARMAWYRLRGLHFAAAAEAQDLMSLENKIGVRKVTATYRMEDE
jgi:hypothetical protein